MKNPASSISDHLLVIISLAFIAGIAVSPLLRLSKTEHTLFCTVLFFSLFLLFLFFYLKKRQTLLYLLIPICFGIGCYHSLMQMQVPGDKSHIYNRVLEKTDLVLIGTMSTMAGFDGRTSQVIIEAKSIRMKEHQEFLPAKGKILLRLQGLWPEELYPGDTVAIRTDLKRPDSFRTPGVFDYAQYLARKNIWITGFVRSPLFLHRIEENQSTLHSLRYMPERLRTRIGKQIDRSVPDEIKGIYRAVLIGDRSNIEESTLEIFKGSGTMHILAISGLHMAVIGTFLYTVFFWLFSRSEKLLLRFTIKKWAAFCSLPTLIGYGLLAGMNTPVYRAVIMSSLVIVSICSNRQKSPGALLAFAAILILSVAPLQLFTTSFLLSFSAIIGIFFILPVLKRLLHTSDSLPSRPALKEKILNWILAGLLVSLVANLATAPIALYSFNRLSTVGLFANLIIEPLICFWSLTAGFLSLPFMFIQPEFSTFLLQIGALGLKVAMYAATFFSSFTFSSIWLPTPPLWLILIYFVSLGLVVFFYRAKTWWSILPVFSLSVCLYSFFHPPPEFPAEDKRPFRISYIDVGQGTSTLIDYPSGFRLLIDGGGSSFAAKSVGVRVIAPFLWKRGIRKIDAIAITHPDADHYNGLDFIVEHFSPNILWVRDRENRNDSFEKIIKQAEKLGIPVSVPDKGQHLSKSYGSLKCIANSYRWPEIADIQDSRDKGNSGLILRADFRNLSALFPGDIGKSVERELVKNGADLKADFLLASHHGSSTSNSTEFLAAVAPKYLMVSAGRSSKGYFPHDHLAQECDERQIYLMTTAAQGTLEIVANKEGYQIYGYKKSNANPLSSYKPVLLDQKVITPR
ncbi:MAG: DNA internalization-related competence protein ComEC/Rec2 [Desulforhopalus sp.]